MTEEQYREEIAVLGQRFSELSYNYAPIEEVMKAFNEWWDMKEESGIKVQEKPNTWDCRTNHDYDNELHNIKR